jgi:hypothetical protein
MSGVSAITITIAGFLVGFPLLWFAIVHLLARLGGWTRLAREFTAEGRRQGERFSWRSGGIGRFVHYNHCLDVAISHAGIALHPVLPFRPGHAPLLIPWSSVEHVATGRWLFQVSTTLTVRTSGGRTAKITLTGADIAQSLARHAPVGTPVEGMPRA